MNLAPSGPSQGGSRWVRPLIVGAVGCVLLGVAVVVLGPLRWSHDRSDAARDRETASTLATCLRFQSLVARVGEGPISAAEMQSRASDLQTVVVSARTDVREAVADFQREVTATKATALTPAGARLATACATP